MKTPGKIRFRPPYLIFIGDEQDARYAKTGFGIVQWRRRLVAGQFRLSGCRVDLGVPDLSIEAALQKGAKSLVIGVAPIGGTIPDIWQETIVAAARAGLDIVAGLHSRLTDNAELVAAANESGAKIIDVRMPPSHLPVGTGKRRSGKRILTVGTDCAVGKKYTALALQMALQEAGVKSTYRATGQTGIMIAGEGIAIDAVVADFISGAAEVLSPDNEPDHWDVIEGQGSVFHPGYSGVSLGLLHGSQPDAFVVCHDATRTVVSGWQDYKLPGIGECIELHQSLGRRTNPDARCIGVSVNTSGLPQAVRKTYLENLVDEVGLPCVDPLIDGCKPIVQTMRELFGIV